MEYDLPHADLKSPSLFAVMRTYVRQLRISRPPGDLPVAGERSRFDQRSLLFVLLCAALALTSGLILAGRFLSEPSLTTVSTDPGKHPVAVAAPRVISTSATGAVLVLVIPAGRSVSLVQPALALLVPPPRVVMARSPTVVLEKRAPTARAPVPVFPRPASIQASKPRSAPASASSKPVWTLPDALMPRF